MNRLSLAFLGVAIAAVVGLSLLEARIDAPASGTGDATLSGPSTDTLSHMTDHAGH